jgi:mannitol-1-/sugar-/sorbitol-6-/2-deoxyglucose-6-phosphatase
MIKAVLFDMDGLLIDSEPIWREAEKEIFAKVGIRLTDEMCFETVGLRIDEVVEHWHRIYPWNHPEKNEIRDLIIAKVIELIMKKGNPLPGVYEILNFFRNENIPLGIASASSRQIIATVVDKLEIRNYFNVIHSAEGEQFGKPHPAVYLSAAEMLNVNPVECLVFEDSFNGVIAAKAARMKVIAVPEDIHLGEMRFHAADYQLKSLTEFSHQLWEKLNL